MPFTVLNFDVEKFHACQRVCAGDSSHVSIIIDAFCEIKLMLVAKVKDRKKIQRAFNKHGNTVNFHFHER